LLRCLTVLVAALAAVLALATPARADSFTIALDGPIAGQPTSPTVSGTPTITFTDTGTNEVTITFDLTGLTGSEKVKSWFFNSSFDLTGYSFVYQSALSDAEASGIDIVFNSTSQFKADGTGGYHDIRFTWDTSGANRFDAGEKSVYKISGAGISASAFGMAGITSSSSGEVYRSVAHILALSGGASVWQGDVGTPVPEPGSIALLAAGLAALGLRRRRAAGSTDINV
jgi:hypothetical protein